MRILVIGVSHRIETFLSRLFSGLALSGIRLVVAAPGRNPFPEMLQKEIDWIELPSSSSPARFLRFIPSALFASRYSHKPFHGTESGLPLMTVLSSSLLPLQYRIILHYLC